MTRSVSSAQLYVPTLDAAMKRRHSLVSRHNTHTHMTRSVSSAQLYVPTLDAAMKRRHSLVSSVQVRVGDVWVGVVGVYSNICVG